eukprot:TRINITY_DN4161_c0_g1_i2.p1 TRINITY_DN4161_c0_g1~~TRINITY_DN4161_c0_g1_i2.p1  ORF type:complete len:478 (+),score=88.75 TRINITY_DN4161_c0_g1_i2:85-1518(+)
MNSAGGGSDEQPLPDEVLKRAFGRSSSTSSLPARALGRRPSGSNKQSCSRLHIPLLHGRTLSKAGLHPETGSQNDITPLSLPSTRSTCSKEEVSDDMGSDVAEMLAKLRGGAIDRHREHDQVQLHRVPARPASRASRIAAAQACLAPIQTGRRHIPGSSPASGSRSPMSATSPSFRLEQGTLLSLAARRRVSMPGALEIPKAPPQKGIRKLKEGEKIFDIYYWEEVLQEAGDGGKVVVCKPKDSQEEGFSYVMKIRSKESLQKDMGEEEFVRCQLRMLNFSPRPGVMHVHEMLEDDNFYYIVMDKARGGSLFNSLLSDYKDGVMPLSAVRNLAKEILEAVALTHREGILHRDIKPDNLVVQLHNDPASPGSKVKKVTMIDFDHADTEFSPHSPKNRNRFSGSLHPQRASDDARGDNIVMARRGSMLRRPSWESIQRAVTCTAWVPSFTCCSQEECHILIISLMRKSRKTSPRSAPNT